MPPLQLLIKPVSGRCNMRCGYCFYTDEADKRKEACRGVMSGETLEKVVEKALDYADHVCTFTFQGGEPVLAGLTFYEKVIALQKKYNRKQTAVQNAIQTNGYALDKDWCRFLAGNHFLVGLSLDGIRATHDACRKSAAGEDTFFRVLDSAKMLKEAGAQFNILTVVNAVTAPKIRRIYEFYKKNGFSYQQYIACLDPVFEKPGGREYSLTPKRYGEFLTELFDLWDIDLRQGRQPYIRQFENYVAILLGKQPESCEQRGVCGIQHVVEADGEVYPCDFFSLDGYELGNLTECGFDEIAARREEIGFVKGSLNQDEQCRKCPYFALCRGGCNRHRIDATDAQGIAGKRNYFCEGYRMFFDHSMKRLSEIAREIAVRSDMR